MGNQDVRVLCENTSDYDQAADDIAQPMGEVLQTFGEPEDSDSDDEFVMPEDLRKAKNADQK